MARAIRAFLAVAVLACVPVAIRTLTIEPWRCNLQRHRTAEFIDRWYESPRRDEVVLLTREHLSLNRGCEPHCAANATMFMQRGALLEMLGQPEEAIATYQEMLAHHQRPEVYRAIALRQLLLGRNDEAMATLTTGARFAPWIMWSAEFGEMNALIQKRLRAEDPHWTASGRNPLSRRFRL